MRVKVLLEKIITGNKVKFFTTKITQQPYLDKKVMAFKTDSGKMFIIKHSLKNYVRFKDWEGKEAIADVEPVPVIKLKTEDGVMELCKINTEVVITREKTDNKTSEYDDLDL